MTELTFAILKYGFVIALWLFAWMAVRSLHRDITSFLPSSKRSHARRKREKSASAVMVGSGDADQPAPPVHAAAAPVPAQMPDQSAHAPHAARREPRSVTNEMSTDAIHTAAPALGGGLSAAGASSSNNPSLLVVIDGPLAGASVPLTGQPITLGRGTSNTVVLDDEFVSSSHARVFMNPQTHTWMIEDLSSTNGTFVNESRINGMMTLAPRVPVRIGATTFELR